MSKGTVLLLAVLLLAGRASAVQAGDVAPDFDLPRAEGGRATLGDYLKAGPVLLWFPDLDANVAREASDLVETAGLTPVVAIPVVGPEPDRLRPFAAGQPRLSVLHDREGTVVLAYTGEFIPGVSPSRNLYVVDPSRRVVYVGYWPGIPRSILRSRIEAARLR